MNRLLPKLEESIAEIAGLEIAPERLALLQPIRAYLLDKLAQGKPLAFNFICTHNSRRSTLSQAWAQALSFRSGLSVACYAGGTEATAFFPKAAEALARDGFALQMVSQPPNPVYSLRFAENALPAIAFSKRFDHPHNALGGFAAVMTCTDADEACPFVPGAEARFPLPFLDPKKSDGTPQQEQVYWERSRQIAREMMFIFEKP